jgi:glycosyltransferase involved in cell wall biosynthesis
MPLRWEVSSERVRRPRVGLVVHDIAPFGGMDRALTELIERACDRFEFVVFSRTLAGELRALVEWHRVPVPARPIPLKFALFFTLAGLRLAREPIDLACSVGAVVPNRVDVAWVHHCHTAFYRATGRLSPADIPISRRLNTSILRTASILAERWSYGRNAAVLSAVSKGLAEELGDNFPSRSVQVIPNGVDAARFHPDTKVRREIRSHIGVSEDVIALFVGGDWGHKGLSVAIEALARATCRGAAMRLWVVGSGDERRYSALARSLGVGDSVTFFGRQVGAERFYQASDLFVLPSQYEALPLVALEALASGLPLVATPVNGIAEMFADNEPGILVDRTPGSVSDALVRLASDVELRRRLGEAGRRIARDYTWQRSISATVELFERLLAEKQRQPAESRMAEASG